MERENQTEPEAGTVTPLDQALWSVLTAESALAPFSRAWLALLCRMLPGAARAVLVLRQDGALAPIARWPEGDPGSAQLAHVAELALTERRGVVSRPGGRAPGHSASRVSHLGFPLLFGGGARRGLNCVSFGFSRLMMPRGCDKVMRRWRSRRRRWPPIGSMQRRKRPRPKWHCACERLGWRSDG
jgi:hypothetical protein